MKKASTTPSIPQSDATSAQGAEQIAAGINAPAAAVLKQLKPVVLEEIFAWVYGDKDALGGEVSISGLPSGSALSAGQEQADGSWSVPTDQLQGLQVWVPEHFQGALELLVAAGQGDAAASRAFSIGDVGLATLQAEDLSGLPTGSVPLPISSGDSGGPVTGPEPAAETPSFFARASDFLTGLFKGSTPASSGVVEPTDDASPSMPDHTPGGETTGTIPPDGGTTAATAPGSGTTGTTPPGGGTTSTIPTGVGNATPDQVPGQVPQPSATSTATPPLAPGQTATPDQVPQQVPQPSATGTATPPLAPGQTATPDQVPGQVPQPSATGTATPPFAPGQTATPDQVPQQVPQPSATGTATPPLAPGQTATPDQVPGQVPQPSATGTATPPLAPGQTATPDQVPQQVPQPSATGTATPPLAPGQTATPDQVPGQVPQPSATGTATPPLAPGQTATPDQVPQQVPQPSATGTATPPLAPGQTATPDQVPGQVPQPSATGTATPPLAPGQTATPDQVPGQVPQPSATGTATPPLAPGQTATPDQVPQQVPQPSATGTATPPLVPGQTATPDQAPQQVPQPSATGTATPPLVPSQVATPDQVPQQVPQPSATGTATPPLVPGQVATPDQVPQQVPQPSATGTATPPLAPSQVATPDQVPQQVPQPSATGTATPPLVPGQVATPDQVPQQVPQPSATGTATPPLVPGQIATPDQVPQQVPQPSATGTATPPLAPGQTATPDQVPGQVPQPSATGTATPPLAPGQTATPDQVPQQVPQPSATGTATPPLAPGQTATPDQVPGQVPQPSATGTATPPLAPGQTATPDQVPQQVPQPSATGTATPPLAPGQTATPDQVPGQVPQPSATGTATPPLAPGQAATPDQVPQQVPQPSATGTATPGLVPPLDPAQLHTPDLAPQQVPQPSATGTATPPLAPSQIATPDQVPQQVPQPSATGTAIPPLAPSQIATPDQVPQQVPQPSATGTATPGLVPPLDPAQLHTPNLAPQQLPTPTPVATPHMVPELVPPPVITGLPPLGNNPTPTLTVTGVPNGLFTPIINGVAQTPIPLGPTGTATYTPTLPVNQANTVGGTVISPAGNTSPPASTQTSTVDTTAPTVTVNAVPLTNDNTPDITGTTDDPNAAIAVTVGGHTYTATNNGDGTWTLPGSQLAGHPIPDGASNQITATATDTAGNTGSASATATAAIDTAAPVPTIAVDAITPDNVINATETGGNVDVTGTVTGEFKDGDTVTLTVGGQTHTGQVDAAGKFSISVPGSELQGVTSVNAAVATTDAAGNTATATATHGYTVDTSLPQPTLSIDSVTTDDVLNAAEAGQSIAITGTVGGDFSTGDMVTLSVNGTDFTGTVDAAGKFSIDVPGTDLKADPNTQIDGSVSTTDAAGNTATATATHGYTVDTSLPAPTLSIDTVTTDDVLNAAEAGQSIAITGTVGGDFSTGDTVTLSVNGKDFTGQVDAQGAFSIDVPGSDLKADPNTQIDGSVSTTDAAGNTATATATHGYTVDTSLPAPTLSIDSVTTDDVLNAAEAGQSIAITGTVGGDFSTGDTVTLSVNGKDFTGQVNAQGAFSIDVPGSDLKADPNTQIDGSVSTIDAAGNTATATATHGYTVDTSLPAPTLSIDTVTTDDVLNAAEAGQSIAITGTVGGDFSAGDTVTLSVNGADFTGTVDAAGKFSIDVPGTDLKADPNTQIDGSVSTTDAAGNTAAATATHGYTVDTSLPAPTLSIDSVTTDDVLNAAEAGQSIAITGTVGGDFSAGDTVTLSVNGTDFTGTVDAAGKFSIDVPGSDLKADPNTQIDGSVSTTDAAGNTATATATHGYTVDTSLPAPTLSIDSVTTDDVLNAAEAGQSVAITGTVGGDFSTGDTVTLSVNGTDFTGTVDAAGKFSIDVPGSDLKADPNTQIDGSVSTTDAAGNTATATATHGYTVDTSLPQPTLSIDGVTTDDVLNAAEAGQSIAITGTVGGDFSTGDTVTLSVNGTDFTGTVDAAGKFSIDVPGTDLKADPNTQIDGSVSTTDAAGNTATATATHGYTVDAGAPAVTVNAVALTNDNTPDITGTTDDHAATIEVTVAGQTHTATNNGDGTWTLPGSQLAAHPIPDGASNAISVTATDAAGNTGSASATAAIDTAVTATDDTAAVTEDTQPSATGNVLTNDEQGATVTSTGEQTGSYGKVTINADGSYTYTLDARAQALEAKEQHPEQFSYTVTDAAGNTATATLTVTVTGTDDAPVVSKADVTIDELDPNTEALISGLGSGSTTDAGDQLGNAPPAMQAAVVQSVLDAIRADPKSFNIPPGQAMHIANLEPRFVEKWADVIDDLVIQKLHDLGYHPSMGHTSTVLGQTGGQSPAPMPSGAQVYLETSGQLTITDADAGEAKFQAGPVQGQYGALQIDENGHWSYRADEQQQAIQQLGPDQHITDTLTVKTADGHTTTVTITINGAIDAPTLHVAATDTVDRASADATGGLQQIQIDATEDQPIDLAISAQAFDHDATETVTYTLTGVPAGASLSHGTQNPDGSWTLTTADLQNLELTPPKDFAGAMDIDVEAKVTDGGQTAASNVLLHIDVAGAQDAAQIGGTDSATVTEDKGVTPQGELTAGGTLTVTDPDAGEAAFTPVAGAAGTYGTFTLDAQGHWTYTADNSQQAVDQLGPNSPPLTDTLQVTSVDGTAHDITVTITGTNDKPAITTPAQQTDGDVTEDKSASTSVTGTMAATDVDNADADLRWKVVGGGHGNYGNVSIDAKSGQWTYTIDNSKPATQQLADGDVKTDTVQIGVVDPQHGYALRTLHVTVHGTNDDPVLSVSQSDSTTGTLTQTDVDTGDTHTFSVASGTGQFGTLTVDPSTGAYTYTPQSGLQGMTLDPQTGTYSGTDTFEVTVTDNHGGTDTQYITFNPSGTVSAPAQPGGQPTVTTSVPANPTVSTTAPAATTPPAATSNAVTIDLAATSDTGTSDTDNLTSDTTPSITGTTDIPFSKVEILEGGKVIATTTSDAQGHYSVDTPALTDGAHTLIAQATGPAETSPTPSSGLDMTVDAAASVTDDTAAVTEDSQPSVTGNVLTNDDQGLTLTNTGDQQGSYGTLTLNADGSYSYTLDQRADPLEPNDHPQETFTYEVTDAAGNTAQATLTVDITGANEAPVVTAVTASMSDGDQAATRIMGQAVATDVEGDALTWQLLDASGQPVAAGSGLHGDHGGVLIMTPTGRWIYQIGPDEAMKLPEGAQAQDHFAFRVTDAHGNSTDSTVTIDITGENNAPIIRANWEMGFVDKDVFLTNTDARLQVGAGVGVGSEVFSGLVIEDTFHAMAGHTSTKTTASSQEIHDGFAGQQQSIAGQQSSRGQGTGSGATHENAADEHPDHVTWSVEGSTQGTYGSLALDSTTGEWVYTLDTSRAATQALAAAEVQPGAFIPTDASGSLPSDTFTIKVTDDHGLTDTKVIKIAVVGTNDDPVLSVTQTTPTTGTLTETDVDTGDTHIFSVASGTGQFGTLTVDPSTGAYTYTPQSGLQGMTLDPQAGTYSGTDTFEVTVTDNHGGTDTQYITFSPTGTVSAPAQPGGQPTVTTGVPTNPTLSATAPAATTPPAATSNAVTIDLAATSDTGTSDTDNLTSDATPSITGTTDIPFSKVEILEGGKVIATTTSDAQGHYSVDTPALTDGAHSLTAQATGPAETSPTPSSALDLTVDAGASVTDDTAAVTEDTQPSATGNVLTNDDQGLTLTNTGDQQGSYGTLTLNADGSYSYTLDQRADTLGATDHPQETFTYEVTDAAGNTAQATLTIDIAGTNDAPVIAGTTTGAVTDADASASKAGSLTDRAMGRLAATDAEGDPITWQLIDATGAEVRSEHTQFGTFLLSPSGQWAYKLNDDVKWKLQEADQEQEQFTIRATDSQGRTTDQTITIDIDGANNAPVLTLDSFAKVTDKDVFLTTSDVHVDRVQGVVVEDELHLFASHHGSLPTATGSLQLGVVNSQGASISYVKDEDESSIVLSVEGSIQGTYGSLSVDPSTGTWTYTIDNTLAATQALSQSVTGGGTATLNPSETDTFTLKVTDDHGLSSTQTLKIGVFGTNDAPVLSVTQTTPTTGTLTETDVDTGDTHTFSVASGAGQFGTLTVDPDTGAYTYTPSGSVQGMAQDPNTGAYSGTDTFEVTVTDNHGGTDIKYITFSPTGTVSAPAQPGGQPTVTTSVAANPAVTDTPPAAGGTAAPDAPDTTLVEDISITLSPDGLSADGEAAAAGLAVADGADLQIDPDATLEGLLVTTDADGNQQTFDFTQSLGDLSSAAPTADGAAVDSATADAAAADAATADVAAADADTTDTASVASSEIEPIADIGGADHLSPYLDMVGAADGGNGGQAGLSASAESPYLDSVGVTPDRVQAGAGADTTLDDDASVAAADPFDEPPQSETDDPLQAIEGLPDDLPMMEPPPVADLDIDQQHHG